MAEFYKFLASYEVLIYIMLAIGGMFSFRWLWRSWSEWRIAVFSLEREFSARRLGRSIALSALILVFFCVEFFIHASSVSLVTGYRFNTHCLFYMKTWIGGLS